MAARLLWFAAVIGCVCAASINQSPETYDTIVVGLGASGTSAASKLAKAGKKVLALEAQGRVGGRVHTVPCKNGVVEVGAEWIHGNESSKVYEIAKENNINVLPQAVSMEVFLSNGTKPDIGLMIELFDTLYESMTNPPDRALPLGEYMTEKFMEHINEKHPELLNDQDFINGVLNFADMIVNSYEASNSWNDVSTLGTSKDLGGNQEISWHSYGYKTLFELLLNTYGNKTGLPTLVIKLNTEVVRVNWPERPSESVLVTCKDGSVYAADNVIVTVSVGVLKERHTELFSPALPQKKIDAIENIQFGVVGKVILEFDEVWWNPDINNFEFIWTSVERNMMKKEDFWLTRILGANRPMGCDKSLTLWLTGEPAKTMESLPEETVRQKSMVLIRLFMGTNLTIPEPVNMIRSTWYSNPYTRGSYTYDGIDAPQHPTGRAELAEPITDSSGKPRVLFAGEASNTLHYATVHGAMETGYREAERLVPTS